MSARRRKQAVLALPAALKQNRQRGDPR